jgi:hypothetical protein
MAQTSAPLVQAPKLSVSLPCSVIPLATASKTPSCQNNKQLAKTGWVGWKKEITAVSRRGQQPSFQVDLMLLVWWVVAGRSMMMLGQ